MSNMDRRRMSPDRASPECFPTRIARAGRHVDRGEWASGHAILAGLRECALRGGCPMGDNCAAAAELLMCDLRHLVGDGKGAGMSQS